MNIRYGSLAVVLTLLALSVPARAQVSGISYTVAPSGSYVFWEDNAGFESALFYGGSLGFGFGEFLEVSGLYLVSPNVNRDVTDLNYGDLGTAAFLDAVDGLEEVDYDIRRYGGRIRVNIGSGRLLPFITLGTGILEFAPDLDFLPDEDGFDETNDINDQEYIYATAGVGITLSVADRYTLALAYENLAYRYNPGTLFSEDELSSLGIGADVFKQTTVYNSSVTAAVRFYLGGREPGELTELDRALRQQLRGSSIRVFVRPFYGQINFNKGLLNLPDKQPVLGLDAGIDLGPYIGIRGFYWRATDESEWFNDPTDIGDISFYGSELNLRFAREYGSIGITPYLTVGGGYMDVLSGFEATDGDDNVLSPEDRFFAIGGAGAELPLSESLLLHGGLRYLLMSNQDVEDLSEPSSVFGSPLWSFGVEFSFGSGPDRTAGRVLDERLSEVRSAEEARAEEARMRMQDMQAEIDSLNRVALERQEERMIQEREMFDQLQARLDSLERVATRRDTFLTAAEQEQIVELRDSLEAEQIATVARLDSLAETTDFLSEPVTVRETERRQPASERDSLVFRGMAEGAAARTSNLSGRTITLPVPEVGEIYVRFGEMDDGSSVEAIYGAPTVVQPGGVQAAAPGTPASGLTAEEIRVIVRETIAEELRQAQLQDQAPTEQEIEQAVRRTLSQELQSLDANEADALEQRRVEDRLQELENRLNERIDDVQERALEDDEGADVSVIDRGRGTTVVNTSDDGMGALFGRPLQSASPYVGTRFGEGPTQFQIGLRGEYAQGNSPLSFVPEFAVGIGNSISFTALLNGAVGFGEGVIGEGLAPYAGVGAGLLTEKGFKGLDLAFNVMVGTKYSFGNGATVFGEYSTLNLFDYNRLLLGYRVRF